uniref:Uncharacterized protein n=1 Tax=Picea sitchensis TaxID=3332 RepID=D5AAI9_PICSI|nr:unknown [Picea sitchensis]
MATLVLLVSQMLRRSRQCADPVLASVSTHYGRLEVPLSNPVTLSSVSRGERREEEEEDVKFKTDISEVLRFRVSLPDIFP